MGTIRIDGVEVEFAPGESVLQAAQRVGITIPTLCYDRRLAAMGSCRLGVVRGGGRPLAARPLAGAPGGGRGCGTPIAAPLAASPQHSPCTLCGQSVQTCPTGALFDRKMAGRARAEDVTKVRTICPFCGTGCGIELNVAKGEGLGVTPDFTSPVNEGALCVKGQWAWDFVHSPERLTKPLIKEDGRFREASWGEALAAVAG